VVLLQDMSMLGQESLLLQLYNRHLSELLVLLGNSILLLDFTLSSVDGESVLPETLDLTFVILLAHASFLGVHLLETFILGKLLHKFVLEFVLKSLLLSGTLSLKTSLELLGSLQFFTNSVLSGDVSTLLGKGGLFFLLNVQFVSEVLLEFLFKTTLFFLSSQLHEEGFSLLFSSGFHALDLVLSHLLLGSIAADHLILVLFELLLSSQKGTFLLLGELHISLSLLLLLSNDSTHFGVFINHLLNHIVNLLLFLNVFGVGFSADFFLLTDLVLDVLLVVDQVGGLLSLQLSVKTVLVFLSLEVVGIDVSVLFQVNLLSELSLGLLGGTFLVEVSMSNAGLEFLKLVTLTADLLDLTLSLLVSDLHLGHLTGQRLLHGSKVDSLSALRSLVLLTDSGVELCLSEITHIYITAI
jgi:hypothetical protein